MRTEIRDNRYKLIDEKSNLKLYTYTEYHYTGNKKHYWLEGEKGEVIKRIHEIFSEDKFSFPKFEKVKDNINGTVIYKGDKILNRNF